jgi:hypothetical protein
VATFDRLREVTCLRASGAERNGRFLLPFSDSTVGNDDSIARNPHEQHA